MSAEFSVVFALYPGVTQLDFTGADEVFSRLPDARCLLASVGGGRITAGGMVFEEVRRLGDIGHCSLLCVPGGRGTIAALTDAHYLDEVRRLSRTARYVTSVCTGSLRLAAAGLLTSRRAWSVTAM